MVSQAVAKQWEKEVEEAFEMVEALSLEEQKFAEQ